MERKDYVVRWLNDNCKTEKEIRTFGQIAGIGRSSMYKYKLGKITEKKVNQIASLIYFFEKNYGK